MTYSVSSAEKRSCTTLRRIIVAYIYQHYARVTFRSYHMYIETGKGLPVLSYMCSETFIKRILKQPTEPHQTTLYKCHI